MEPAGVPRVDASPSAPAPWRPGYCTHVPGIGTLLKQLEWWIFGRMAVSRTC